MDNRREILNITELSVSFPMRYFKQTSLKDLFIQILSGPFSKNYSKSEKPILKNISLNVKEGDRIGIVGVNGAGKSTLCRAIAGIYSSNSGIVERKGRVRAIFGSALYLYSELSGRENARVIAEIYYPEYYHELESIIEESLAFSELGEYLDAPLKTYSNGMLVRLTLSLLSAKPTDLLILDEVFDGADEFFREKIAKRVRNLIDNSGAVIFVSHYQSQIETICNRALLLSNGELIYDGNINETFNLYRK